MRCEDCCWLAAGRASSGTAVVVQLDAGASGRVTIGILTLKRRDVWQGNHWNTDPKTPGCLAG